MRSLFSRIFYLSSFGGFIFSVYNGALAVNSLFQKSSEASGPIFHESKQFIYIAIVTFLSAFILLIIGRKISKNSR